MFLGGITSAALYFLAAPDAVASSVLFFQAHRRLLLCCCWSVMCCFPLLVTIKIVVHIPGLSWSTIVPVHCCFMEVVELTHFGPAGKGQASGTCNWEKGLQSLLPAFKFVLHRVITGLRWCHGVYVIITSILTFSGTSEGKEQLQEVTCPGHPKELLWNTCFPSLGSSDLALGNAACPRG